MGDLLRGIRLHNEFRVSYAPPVAQLLAFLAVGCPLCNKVVVLLLGASGALTYFEPIQPLWREQSVQRLHSANLSGLERVEHRPSAGGNDFDIDLPLTGTAGVECRSGGANGLYNLIYTFHRNISVPGTATKTQGSLILGVPVLGPNANQVTVPLRSVNNAQHVVITLNGVQETAGPILNNSVARMDVLLADVDSSGRVDSNDVTLVRQQALQSLTNSNFREDIDVSGRIDSNDATIARQQALTSLPASSDASARPAKQSTRD